MNIYIYIYIYVCVYIHMYIYTVMLYPGHLYRVHAFSRTVFDHQRLPGEARQHLCGLEVLVESQDHASGPAT